MPTNAVGNSPELTSTTAVVPVTVPGVPNGVTATRGNGSATVTWTAPADNGGSPVTGYTVSSPEGGPTVSVTVKRLHPLGHGHRPGQRQPLHLHRPRHQRGGQRRLRRPVGRRHPATTPGTPTGVIATRGDGAATVSWTAPSTDGGSVITRYTVTASPGGLHANTTSGSSAVVTGLTNGTAYTFTVHATNAVGNGPESAPSAAVTPATTPGAPTIGTAVAGNGTAAVSCTAPTSNGGSSVTGYTVTSHPGSITATVGAGATSATITGLTNGTAYTFSVHAGNAIGTGTESARSSAVTPATVPGAPTVVSVDARDGRVTVSWSAPAGTGGAAITGYTVTAAPGGATATTDGTTHTADVTGLVNGTAYTFTVTDRFQLKCLRKHLDLGQPHRGTTARRCVSPVSGRIHGR